MKTAKLYFRLHLYGSPAAGRFSTADEAMEFAKGIFMADHSLAEAHIYRNDVDHVITIRNKDYQKPEEK